MNTSSVPDTVLAAGVAGMNRWTKI
jgi:hypothetical protein